MGPVTVSACVYMMGRLLWGLGSTELTGERLLLHCVQDKGLHT